MIDNFLICSIPYFIYVMYKSLDSFHMLQQNKYNRKKTYLKWLKNNPKQFIDFSILFVLFIIFMFTETADILLGCFAGFYIILIVKMYLDSKSSQNKLPLKYTARMKRLLVTNLITNTLPILIMALFVNESNLIYFILILGLIGYLNNLYILVALLINTPVESYVGYYFKRKAINKLKSMPDLKVIGITGSYGKTSSKNILSDILNVKYNALPSPKNFNTPYGLIITVNNYLDKFDDILIAEMGAYKVGEIKELCDLVKPKYGILTKIGTAHIEIFGSQKYLKAHDTFKIMILGLLDVINL